MGQTTREQQSGENLHPDPLDDSEFQIVDLDVNGEQAAQTSSVSPMRSPLRPRLLQGQRLSPRVRLGMSILTVVSFLALGAVLLINFSSLLLPPPKSRTLLKSPSTNYLSQDVNITIAASTDFVAEINAQGMLEVLRLRDHTLVWRRFNVKNMFYDKTGGIIYALSARTPANMEWVALRASDGAELHTYQGVDRSEYLYAVEGGLLYFVGNDPPQNPKAAIWQFMRVVRASDGIQLWRQGRIMSFTVKDGICYILPVPENVPDDVPGPSVLEGRLEALRARDGSRIWSYDHVKNVSVVNNGMLFIVASQGITALRTGDGQVLWRADVHATWITLGDGVVYAHRWPENATENAVSLTVLDENDGHKLWNIEGDVQSLPYITSNAIVFAMPQGGTLRALDSRTGRLLWQTGETRGKSCYDVIAEANAAYFVCQSEQEVSTEQSLIAFRISDGHWLWQKTISNWALVTQNGVAYARGASNSLNAYRLRDGALLWRYWSPTF